MSEDIKSVLPEAIYEDLSEGSARNLNFLAFSIGEKKSLVVELQRVSNKREVSDLDEKYNFETILNNISRENAIYSKIERDLEGIRERIHNALMKEEKVGLIPESVHIFWGEVLDFLKKNQNGFLQALAAQRESMLKLLKYKGRNGWSSVEISRGVANAITAFISSVEIQERLDNLFSNKIDTVENRLMDDVILMSEKTDGKIKVPRAIKTKQVGFAMPRVLMTLLLASACSLIILATEAKAGTTFPDFKRTTTTETVARIRWSNVGRLMDTIDHERSGNELRDITTVRFQDYRPPNPGFLFFHKDSIKISDKYVQAYFNEYTSDFGAVNIRSMGGRINRSNKITFLHIRDFESFKKNVLAVSDSLGYTEDRIKSLSIHDITLLSGQILRRRLEYHKAMIDTTRSMDEIARDIQLSLNGGKSEDRRTEEAIRVDNMFADEIFAGGLAICKNYAIVNTGVFEVLKSINPHLQNTYMRYYSDNDVNLLLNLPHAWNMVSTFIKTRNGIKVVNTFVDPTWLDTRNRTVNSTGDILSEDDESLYNAYDVSHFSIDQMFNSYYLGTYFDASATQGGWMSASVRDHYFDLAFENYARFIQIALDNWEDDYRATLITRALERMIIIYAKSDYYDLMNQFLMYLRKGSYMDIYTNMRNNGDHYNVIHRRGLEILIDRLLVERPNILRKDHHSYLSWGAIEFGSDIKFNLMEVIRILVRDSIIDLDNLPVESG